MIDFPGFIDFLTLRMQFGLPGKKAHERMIPPSRLQEFVSRPMQGKKSAALLLLYPHEGTVKTLLIRRPVYDGVHSGQIALPGGKYSEEDKTLEQTALREASEETGLNPDQVTLIGPLTTFLIPPSNFLLTPFVGHSASRPRLSPNSHEVDRIFEVDIRDISDKNLKEKDIRIHAGTYYHTPYYDIQQQVVWGATGMVLSEFSELMRDYRF